MNILNIGTWSSRCDSCGRDCNPYEKKHETNMGYSEEIRKQPGCGVEYTHVTTDYFDLAGQAQAMRPDLIFIDHFEGIRNANILGIGSPRK